MALDMADIEMHDEVVEWMDSLDDDEWNRTVVVIDRLVALTTFRKQRNNERTEIARARRAVEDCARANP